MRRCVYCRKRLWPFGSGIESRFGWIHVVCLDKKLREEWWSLLEDSINEILKRHARQVAAERESPITNHGALPHG